MFYQEWPLILFTLLGQLAVGTFLLLMIARTVLSKKDNQGLSRQWTKNGFLAVAVTMAVGIGLSMFHLGAISNAINTLSNFGSSWLSREIVFSGMFLALVGATFLMDHYKKNITAVGWITAVVGIVAVYSMASVYTTTIIPAWSHVNTYVAYFGTTMVYGIVGVIACMLLLSKGQKLQPSCLTFLRYLSIAAMVVVILQLAFLPAYFTSLAGSGIAGQASLQLMFDSYAFTMVLRWLLTLAGGGLFLFVFYRFAGNLSTKTPALIYLAISLIVIGEFMGRYLFYAAGIPMQIG
ncbi:dimethyl sulfoxide reductase anchor subunit family protein [Salipaludibacillus daqingensis]|uniref:dimethyl sulfoxide reductase anchor subunit family protein n=1 Tax=Salipaludibacillus daqingensis TaxID=3041001 RepID=UPI0024761D04|nr:DmsC/YnfH family molybdoenzyme membrane anchor subunit [Salipaludibacillus daqingensis]